MNNMIKNDIVIYYVHKAEFIVLQNQFSMFPFIDYCYDTHEKLKNFNSISLKINFSFISHCVFY